MIFFFTLFAAFTATAFAKDSRTYAILYFNGNGPLTEGRSDPVVSPNQISGHVHTVQGGNKFSNSATGQTLTQSTCTTSKIAADKSAYWMPKVYFHDRNNGSFEAVPLYYMKAYYFFEATNDKIQSFPVGLQMVSGNATTRTPPATGNLQLDPAKGAIQPAQFTCSRQKVDYPNYPAGSDGSMGGIQDTTNQGAGAGFPFADCDGTYSPLRADLHFPSCYDPSKALDDYQHNMKFPTQVSGGKEDCPTGWIHTPHLFYEMYWNTPLFKDRWTPNQGYQPFVLANGDTTGFSLHGDFVSAWDTNVLQKIIDTCNAYQNGHGDGMDQCEATGSLSVDDNKCHVPNPSPENIGGSLALLPGNNPLYGWWNSKGGGSPTSTPPTPGTPTSTSAPASTPTGTGWKYAGCYRDTDARVINGETFANIGAVSNTKCVAHCRDKGFSLSGTEYAGQCFCGNSANGAQKIEEPACNMKCDGDAKEVCGGPLALSVYSKTGFV